MNRKGSTMRNWTKLLLGLGALAHGVAAWAGFSACPQHFPQHAPVAYQVPVGELRELCFDAFAVLHSGESRTPLVVVQRLNAGSLAAARSVSRTDQFYEEGRLPWRERAKLASYVRSGYDRGHMAPAAEMPTVNAMAQSFSLANVVPTLPRVNREVWLEVERSTRKFVRRARGEVFTYTGAYFAPGRGQYIGTPWDAVRVPDAIYKLVYDSADKRAWALWIENSPQARMDRPISYQALVERTGIQFLPASALRPTQG